MARRNKGACPRSWNSSWQSQGWGLALATRLKAENMSEGPGTPGAQPHSHSSVKRLDPSVLLLLERPAGYAPSRILEQMIHIFHFMRVNLYYSIFLSFSPSPTAFYIVNRLFKSKDLTRKYKNIRRPTEWQSLDLELKCFPGASDEWPPFGKHCLKRSTPPTKLSTNFKYFL